MPTEFNPNNEEVTPSFTDETPLDDEALWTLLSVYADGEATPEEAAQVEALLRSDPAYAREFAFFKESSTILQGMPEIEPPLQLRDAIFAATTLRPTVASRLRAAWLETRSVFVPRFTRYAFAGGFLVAAGVLAFAFWPRASQSPLPVPPSNKDSVRQQIAKATAPLPVTAEKVPPFVFRPDPGLGAGLGMMRPSGSSHASVPSTGTATGNKMVAHAGGAVAPLPSREKSSLPPKINPQLPSPVTPHEPVLAKGEYFKKPMMDAENQRPVVIVRNGDLLKDDLHGAPDIRTADSDGAAPKATSPSGDPEKSGGEKPNGGESGKVVTASVRIREGQMLTPLPSSRRFLTNAALRQMREARNLGYNEVALEGIKRNQPTLAFSFGKF